MINWTIRTGLFIVLFCKISFQILLQNFKMYFTS